MGPRRSQRLPTPPTTLPSHPWHPRISFTSKAWCALLPSSPSGRRRAIPSFAADSGEPGNAHFNSASLEFPDGGVGPADTLEMLDSSKQCDGSIAAAVRRGSDWSISGAARIGASGLTTLLRNKAGGSRGLPGRSEHPNQLRSEPLEGPRPEASISDLARFTGGKATAVAQMHQ